MIRLKLQSRKSDALSRALSVALRTEIVDEVVQESNLAETTLTKRTQMKFGFITAPPMTAKPIPNRD